MGLSAPWDDSFDSITLQPIKKWLGINAMVLSVPWFKFLELSPSGQIN